MARETELGFKIKRVLGKDDQWDKIVKETEAFYEMLESNPAEINIGDTKQIVGQLQRIRAEYNKINNDADSNRGQIDFANLLCNVLDKAEDKFQNIGVMFKNVNNNTRKYVTGLSNIADHLADTNFGVKFLDVGAQFKELQDRAEELYDTLKKIGTDTYSGGEFSLWNGSFDKEDLRERIEILRKLKDVQSDMLDFDSDMKARDFVSGQSMSGLDDFIRRAQVSLDLLKQSGIETTEELYRLRRNFESNMDLSDLWDDEKFQKAKDHIADTEVYDRSIQNLKDYISKREQLLEKLETGYEGTLFTDDESDDMISTLRRELNEARDQFKVLQDLKGKNVGINFTDVVNALQEIKNAIREIKDAFDPLTQAFANEDSAISKMVNANVEDLNRLQEKFEQVFNNIQTLSQKDFSSKTTNVVQQTINAPGGILKTQRAELKELAKVLAQYQSAIGDLNSKSNIFKKIGLSAAGQLDFFSFDLNEVLAGIKKATTADKLDGWADVLDDYKKGIIKVANEINKIQSGLINLDPLQNQKKKDPDIINLSQASSNVDGILTEVKSIRDQIDAEIQGIRTSFEDIFKFEFLSPNFDNIASITDKIYQQFVELKNKIKTLDFTIQTVSVDSSAAESASGITTESNVMKEIADNAEKAAISKEKFVSANQSVKASAEASSIAVQQEVNALDEVAKKVTKSSNGIRANQDVIIDEYRKLYGGRDKVNSNLASMFNKVLDGADIDVSSIKTAFGTKSYKDKDKNVIEYDYVRLIAEGTDALGKATTVTREYEVATGGLIKKMGTFKDVKDTFDVSKEIEDANSKVAELEKRMGTFKINLDAVRKAANNITDEASLDVFTKELDSANQKLKELKATLKSTHSLDPVTNAESMMSNLDAIVEKLDKNIKKFTGVDGFDELELSLITILEKIDAYNKAVDGMSKAQVVQDVNKEISKFNAQLDLVKAKYQENNRVTKLSLDKDNQFSLLSKQKAQWEKNGQLTDELRKNIDNMLDSLSMVSNSDELSNWKKQWSIVKNEVMETKYQIEAAQKAQAAIDKADAAVQRKEDEDRAYWDKERQIALNNLITPEKRPELEQLKSYMLQQAEVTKESIEEQYNALMTIVTNKNKALQKLMSASGPNEKKHAQDEYSAWFGAWNNLDKDVVNNFFEDAGNQAILGADKIDKFNDELERSKLLYARLKDKEDYRATKESEQAAKKALAEEKALMKEITSEDKLTLDKDKQFALLSKQQAQWGKNGQLTDELRQTINDMLDSLAKVTNSDELTIWKKQWSIVKDEVLATKYEIEAASKAQKATADERKASGAYWDKEFQYSLNNIITPEKRPELEQLKVYMLQQAKATESAVTEQYDAIMTIVRNKNNALQKLMSAKGPNDKQYWQDQYSAWYGAWNKLDRDVVNNFFNDAGNQAILGADKIDKFNDELERSNILSNKLKDQEYNEGQKKQDKVNKQNQNYGKIEFSQATKFLEKMNANVRNLGGTDQISESLNALVQDYTEVYQKIALIRKQFEEDPNAVKDEGLKAKFQDAVLHANNLKQEMQGVFKETQKLESISSDLRLGEAISLDDLDPGDIKSSMIAYANAVSDGTAEIKGFNEAGTEMYGVIDRGNVAINSFTVALDKGTNKLHAYTTATNKASNEWEDFKTQAVSGAKNLVGMYVGFQEGVQAVRAGVGYVKDIDLAMTELKKVTDETDASYKQFLKDAGSTSAIIGSTISDFTEASATFARLGYNLEESSKMAETAIIYKNVADGLDTVEESSESIISTMMAFGIEANDTMSIIDRFNAVGNNFAITSAGIGEALQRSASALYSAGNTIDESVALVTAANSVIQNPEQVGTALKTLALRLRGAKTELEEAGLETDNMAESTSTLQAKLNALTHGKVNIMLDADTFKSTTQILREMSEAWEDMTDIERAAALELMGGKRQANILSSVIQNFETVEDVIETSMNSSGSAIAENEKWLDSIEGKTYQFTNALQTMWSNMLNSEVIKGFLDFGTGAIEMLDTTSGKLIALVTAVRLFSKFKGININGVFQGINQSVQQLNSATQALDALSVADTIDGVFKPSNITAYAAAVSQLTPKLQAQALATKGLSNEQVRHALALNGVDQANIKAAMSQIRMTESTQQAVAVTGQDAAAILAVQKVKLSDVATSFLQEHATEQVTEEMLEQAVAAGTLTATEKTQIVTALGLTNTNHGLAASFKAIRTSISLMFKSNPIGFILSVVSTVMSLFPVFNMLIDSTDDVSDAFNEAMNTVREAQNEFKNLKKSADDIIPRFAELAKGVDNFGNNVSLTDDEYKEFVDLNNEIAELFPELNVGMDSNGNAMLSLSYTADTLTQSLLDLVEAERMAANQEIADTMPDILDGIKPDVKEYEDEIGRIETRLEAYKSVKKAMDDLRNDETIQKYKDMYNDNWKTMWEIDVSLSNDQSIYNLQEAFGAWERPEEWRKLLEKFTVDNKVDWYGVLNSAEMQNAIAGWENQVDDLHTRISKKWQQLNPIVTAWANTDFTYNELSDEMQSVVKAMIGNLDFAELDRQGYDTAEKVQEYIKTNIINKVDELSPTVQQKFKQLMSINANDYSLHDYSQKVKEIAREISDASNFTYDELMKNTGYTNILKDYEKTANNILDILDDSIPKYYESLTKGTVSHFKALDKYGVEVDQLKDKIYSLSPNEITKSFDIISKYGIKTWDELAEALANKTFDVVLNYDAEKEGREKLLAAIEESVSATGLSAESIANLKSRYQDLESYDPARLFEETTNGIHLNTKALNELEREYENLNKTNLDKKLKGLSDQYNDLTSEIQSCADASERAVLYAQRDNILAQINDTATLAARYEGLTSAYNKWQEVQSGKDERNMYEGIISGKKELDEEMKRGWLDQGSIKYLELLSGKDLSTAKYDEILSVYKQLNEQIAGKYDVFDFFTADSSGNSTTAGIYNFFDTVLAKSKEIEEKIGRQVISKNADGGYVFDFGVDGDKAIADVLGISEELVQIILRAAKDAGFDINLDSAYSSLADFKDEVEVVNNRLKELGATTYTFNINSTNLDNVEKQIEEAKNAIKNLENEDGTIKVGVSEEDYQNAKTLLATLIYQKQTLDEAAILHVDTSNAESGIEFVVQKLQEFKAAYNDYEVKAAVGADTSQAEADIQAAITALQGTSPEIRTSLGIDLLKSNEEINTAINNITVDKLIEVGLDSTLVDEYMAAEHSTTGEVVWDNNIQKVTEWMAKKHETDGTVNWGNNIKNVRTHFTATGTIKWGDGASVNGTAHSSGNAYARGSWGAAKTETSLVGELGPEILVRNGKWTTVGDNGAEFTQVKKGDIIFNHKQTEELLKNGHVTGRGKAYANGTAFSSGSGPGRYTITSAHVNGGGSGSAKDEAKEAADEFREVFDWIAVRIEEINEDLDLKNAKLENAIGHKKQNTIVDDMIDLNEKLYDNLLAGANKYYSYAKTLLAKVPAVYRQAAQDGTIAIETFVGEVDEKTLEAIQDYREWVQKGADATQQAEEVITEISSLAKQAIDNISDDYGNKSSIRDSEIDQLDAYNKLTAAKYGSESANIYKEIIKETNSNIKTLQEQRNKMQSELNKQVQAGNIKKYSQDWYDAVNDIAAVDAEIINLTADTYDYQDSINELHWDAFDNLMSRLEAVSDEASNVVDILGNKDLVDEDGNWTDEGITSLGLYAQQMENAEVQSKKYREEINYLNKNWESLGLTEQEYNEKLEELTSNQYDSIKAYHDAKDAIKDLTAERVDAIKNGIEKEIDAFEELIKTKKELLESEKDAYDFQKSVSEQNKEISDIERQLAVLSASDPTTRAKRAQLQAELAKAKADLEETFYEKSIEDQQKALDKELESFQKEKDKELEGWDKYLEDTETVVADGLAVVQNNTEIVYQTLQDMGQEYSLLMSDALTSPWKDGESAIQSYAEKFGLAMSSTVKELQDMTDECEKLMSDTENHGKQSVDKVNNNITNYQDATKEPDNTTAEAPKAVKVGGKINAGSAKIYEYVGDTSGEKQYYSNDPIYKVLKIDGDWVQVRHHKQSTGVAGWFRKSQVKAYAKGSTGIKEDQWALIDELGEELSMHAGKDGKLSFMTKGSTVVPHDITENLMQLGQLNPQDVLDRNRPIVGAPHVTNNETVINIEYGDILHIDNFSGDKPADLSKMIDKAFEKHMKQLNAEIRKFTR